MLKAWGIVIPGVLLVGATALRVADPVPIQEVRNLVFDNYQRMQPRVYDKELPVRIADIDEKSLAKFGQWPWSRSVLSKLVDRLGELGAAVVVFDVLLAEPDRVSPQAMAETLPDDPAFAEVRRRLSQLPDPDSQLANSSAKVPTVFGFALVGYDPKRPEAKPKPVGGFSFLGDNPLDYVHALDHIVAPLPQFQTVAVGNGAVNSDPDPDGVVRRVPLVWNYRGNIGDATDGLLPSLSLESIRTALQAQTYTIRSTGSSGELGGVQAINGAQGIGAIRIEGTPVVIKPNKAGELLLDDTGHQPGRFISIADLFDPDFPRDAVEGRIILIGTSVEGLKDIQNSPLSISVPGVELHAEAIEQILATALTGGLQLQRPYWSDLAEITYLMAFGMLAIAFAYRAGALSGLLVAGIAVVVAFGGSLWLFQHQRLLVDPLYPAGTAVILVMASSTVAFVRTEREKRHVRGAFQRYLSPVLVDQLAQHPERLKLGGEIRELTVMFTDIRGFTKMSEGLNPEELTRVINSFLTPMTTVIQKHKGTIDKYIGDCIMAFWNAPIDVASHGREAIRAAFEMRRELAALNERFKQEAKLKGVTKVKIKAGIGVNSGLCCVGNMGSDQTFNYSAMGDTVNIASRLEALSPAYKLDLVIGEETASAAPEFALLEIDQVKVKGKAVPIRIFTGLGDETVAASNSFVQLKAAHDRMLTAYREQHWGAAAAGLDACRVVAPESLLGLYEVYATRIAEYRAAPPGTGWDGVYVAKSKTG